MGERLERNAVPCLVGDHPAEILPVAAHSDRGGADAAAEIEGEDLRVLVAAEMHRHQCEQHRFAGPGRPDDKGMADIADGKGKPRSEEHTDELQSLMRISYAGFCLKKTNPTHTRLRTTRRETVYKQ